MTDPSMLLAQRLVSPETLPYMIAEVGVNHENDIGLAFHMIEQVAAAGGDAVKFQTYKADRLASRHSPAYWDQTMEAATSQYALFKRYDHFGRDEYRALADRCAEVGVQFLSTPFDIEAVDFLAAHQAAFKIASADLTNLELLEAVASHAKPVILSTGASTLEEVRDAVSFLRGHGADSVALLHCVLSYPTRPADAHLRFIPTLRREFPDCLVGYSDHVPPDDAMLTLTSAYALGAQIIEKHFTHDKSLPGNDHYHAMDKEDLQVAVSQFIRVRELLGTADKRVLECEEDARRYARRSLVAARDLPAGSVLTRADLSVKRPGTGISPLYLTQVVGRKVQRHIAEDEILQFDDLA